MKVKFICPIWGSSELPWLDFLKKVKSENYQGVEIDLPFDKREKTTIVSQLKDAGLEFVGQHWQTKETDFKKHKEGLKRHLYSLAEATPLLINSHTGMDFFTFSQNIELLKMAHQIEQETGVVITHETHRSRFSFAAHICFEFLKELPFVKLTSDFSHWCCVAESMLENQPEAVQKAIEHTFHIHARVGSAQSPQVIDPRLKTYELELKQHIIWWQKMIENAKNKQQSFITITPEYGPVPYSIINPMTNQSFGNQWEINLFMKNKIASLRN